jgi:hypothetical protein
LLFGKFNEQQLPVNAHQPNQLVVVVHSNSGWTTTSKEERHIPSNREDAGFSGKRKSLWMRGQFKAAAWPARKKEENLSGFATAISFSLRTQKLGELLS